MKELIPVKYYHAVFTIPHQLNAMVMGNRTAMFNLLFDAASYTLLKCATDEKYPASQPGIIAVLPPCGQQLSFHPRLNDQSGRENSPISTQFLDVASVLL